MRLLYISGTYAPGAYGGSELSVHTLLRKLRLHHDVDVLVATDKRYTGGAPGKAEYDGVPLAGLDHEQRDLGILRILDAYPADVILTQLLWSDVALEIGQQRGIPAILRLAGGPVKNNLAMASAIVANSEHLARWVRETWHRDCELIHPTIDLSKVIVNEENRAPRYVLMFNPIVQKGGLVFRRIAEAMPSREFAAVPGWHSLRDESGGWDASVIKRSIESQGHTDLDWRPEEVDLSDLDNVTMFSSCEQVADIYTHARIVLVPSQWQEPFGRVAIEAFANGIPVIGSRVGGLKSLVDKAGFAIKDKTNIAEWVAAIIALDDPDTYAKLSGLGRVFVDEHYDADAGVRQFLLLATRVAS